MTRDQLNQLFTEYCQFDANKLQHGGGSGLGLAITKGIIEQHQGTIRAESEGKGCGTTFIIELPLYSRVSSTPESSCTATEELPQIVKVPGPVSSDTASRRILIAEDVASSAKMLTRLLERAGHTCSAVANGQDAINAILTDQTLAVENEDHIPYDTILMVSDAISL